MPRPNDPQVGDVHGRDPQQRSSISASGISRRGFLIGTLGSTAVLAFGLPGIALAQDATDTALKEGQYEPTLWYAIDSNGQVTLHCTKAEMGQHVGTSLARLVAEELEVDPATMRIEYVDSDPKWGYMITGGSWSVNHSFLPLSRAGAAGREALIDAGARLLDVDPARCHARNGQVICDNQRISYGEIVASGTLSRSYSAEELEAIALKPASERRVLGSPGSAQDIPDKTTGAALFGIDAKIDGMVYARPVLPPARFGCQAVSIDDSAAATIPGYQQTLRLEDPSGLCQGWLAVVADSFSAAMRATDALKVEWDVGPAAAISEADIQQEGRRLTEAPTRDNGALFVDSGDLASAFERADADSATLVDATYTTASVLHFQLEPVNATVVERDGHWHIHCGNQQQSASVPLVAKALEVDDSQVTFHQYYLGGGFGRRLYGDYAVPAALAAKALGKPVKMVFTRPDDSRLDCVRSPSVQRLRSAVTASGEILASEHAAAAGWPTAAIAPGFLGEFVDGGGKLDSFAISGADHWYRVAAQRVWAQQNHKAHEAFVPGYLRSVGPGWTTWAVESHMDELAQAAGLDPARFRLALLQAEGRNAGEAPNSVGGAERLKAVLQRALEKSGWSERDTLPEDTGLGVALSFGQERHMPTWVACVARVKVDRSSGDVSVEKLTSVVDAGTLAHPDGAMAQLEGSLLWGLSMALHEGTEYAEGQPSDLNLNSYTPLRMHQVPELDLEFMINDHTPVGLGEPGTCVVAPAIGNAVAHACGVRLRDLPMRAQTLKTRLGNRADAQMTS
ncbi:MULTISPECIES: xanthine dehydrogenase family protein molybdopterin-binding subunit [Halomonas]|uniref:xanthine dehydrogenase family protein molybdopterin-binding subunit n=1 Tax=Halomonas TaxID=2745 RepID=UPI001C9674BF|nr:MULTISPECIES: molybdopterin cofactor-binding domain-containing protein [Halomonas]MBY6207544.1 molybdopterin-dependent oxidoreductase [Halomonas sp. DP3Y7-2]MBY6228353.1 molybdopterin-dependent oxidoreductase [Halomonas sp. DP3Y7-1]MCA0916418.1 molybdopterin-dependent oxidoreductase [Halomonas denitrificans]